MHFINTLIVTVADFPSAVKRLLKNDILMFRTASSVLHILPIAGLYTFLPKYLESQFRLPAHHANMISGNEHVNGTRELRNVSPIILLMICTPREMNRVRNNSDDIVSERSGGRRRKISPPDVRRDYDAKWIIWRKRQNGRVSFRSRKKKIILSLRLSCRKLRQNLSVNQIE